MGNAILFQCVAIFFVLAGMLGLPLWASAVNSIIFMSLYCSLKYEAAAYAAFIVVGYAEYRFAIFYDNWRNKRVQ